MQLNYIKNRCTKMVVVVPMHGKGVAIVRKILACIDGSDLSGPVLREAFVLAGVDEAEGVEVLHVVSSEADNPAFEPGYESAEDPVEHVKRVVRENIEEFMGGVLSPTQMRVPHQVNVLMGNPYKVIVKRAGEGRFDLVVMGHRGLEGLKRFFLGSVAAKVVPYAPCHVLVLRSLKSERPGKVLVAVDGGETSAEVMGFGLDHAIRVGAKEVLFLNVVEDLTEVSHGYWGTFTADSELYLKNSREACEEMGRLLAEITPSRNIEGVELKTEIAKGRTHAAIMRVAEAEGVDLIVVGDRGKSGVDGFLLGSVSAKIVRYAHCGVLVYRTGHGNK